MTSHIAIANGERCKCLERCCVCVTFGSITNQYYFSYLSSSSLSVWRWNYILVRYDRQERRHTHTHTQTHNMQRNSMTVEKEQIIESHFASARPEIAWHSHANMLADMPRYGCNANEWDASYCCSNVHPNMYTQTRYITLKLTEPIFCSELFSMQAGCVCSKQRGCVCVALSIWMWCWWWWWQWVSVGCEGWEPVGHLVRFDGSVLNFHLSFFSLFFCYVSLLSIRKAISCQFTLLGDFWLSDSSDSVYVNACVCVCARGRPQPMCPFPFSTQTHTCACMQVPCY